MTYSAAQICTSCPCGHSGTGVWTAQRVTLAEAWSAIDTYSYDAGEIYSHASGRAYRFTRGENGKMLRCEDTDG